VGHEAYGALWWSFERRYGIGFAPVSWSTLRGGELSRFNVVIVPDASPATMASRLGKDGAEAVKRWVQAGGTLVTMGGASSWAGREDVGLTTARALGSEGDSVAARAAGADSARARKPTRPDSALAGLSGIASPTANPNLPAPGARLELRRRARPHPLAHLRLPAAAAHRALRRRRLPRPSREGSNVAVFPTTGALHRAGFVWNDNTERLLRGSALLVDEPLGDGHVVLFANEPMFRGLWRALDKLVLNAVLLGPAY
jgi:hypothetical protein